MKVNYAAILFNSLVTRIDATYDFDAVILGLTGGIEPHSGKNVVALKRPSAHVESEAKVSCNRVGKGDR